MQFFINSLLTCSWLQNSDCRTQLAPPVRGELIRRELFTGSFPVRFLLHRMLQVDGSRFSPSLIVGIRSYRLRYPQEVFQERYMSVFFSMYH